MGLHGMPPVRWLTIVLVLMLVALVGYGAAQAGAIGWVILVVVALFAGAPALIVWLDWRRTRQRQREDVEP